MLKKKKEGRDHARDPISWEIVANSLSTWVPATNKEDQDGVPGCWLWPSLAECCRHFGSELADRGSVSLRVCVSMLLPNKWK